MTTTKIPSNIYGLYKLVFNNCYISRIIFNYVYIYNKKITNCNVKSNSFTQCVKSIYNLKFEWMIKNNHFSALLYLIESNIKFNGIITTNSLKRLFQFINNDRQLILKLYNTNKMKLLNNGGAVGSTTTTSTFNILEFSIIVSNKSLLKLVNREIIKYGIKTIDTSNLLKTSLECGDLDIIKFVYNDMNLKILNKQSLGIHYSILSDNRSRVFEYYLNEIQSVPIPSQSVPVINKNDQSLLLKLEHCLFQRLDLSIIGSLKLILNETMSSISIMNLQFIKFKEYIQNIIFSTYISDNSKIKYKSILERVNNCSQEQEIKYIYIFEFLVNEIGSSDIVKLNYFKIEFARQYKEYSIIKELLKQYNQYNPFSFINISGFASSKRNGYYYFKNCIEGILLSSYQTGDSQLLFEVLSLYHVPLITQCLIVKEKEASSYKLYEIPHYNHDEVEINIQIQYLSNVLKFNAQTETDSSTFNYKLLERVLNSKLINSSNYQVYCTEIANILNIGGTCKYSALVFSKRDFIFYYFYNNFKNTFSWRSNLIGIQVVENGDLEFIDFLYKNDIGSINSSSLLLDHCKSLSTAKHLIGLNNELFKFSGDSLLKINSLNDYDSNYLFYFATDQLVNCKSVVIKLSTEILSNYKHSKYIASKIMNGQLWLNNLKINSIENSNYFITNPDNQLTSDNWSNHFNVVFKLEEIILFTGNFNHIKSFFKHYQKSNSQNKKRFNFVSYTSSFKIKDPVLKEFIRSNSLKCGQKLL